jgi:hypothetical protein
MNEQRKDVLLFAIICGLSAIKSERAAMRVRCDRSRVYETFLGLNANYQTSRTVLDFRQSDQSPDRQNALPMTLGDGFLVSRKWTEGKILLGLRISTMLLFNAWHNSALLNVMLVFINSICIVFITCGVSLIVRVLCFV